MLNTEDIVNVNQMCLDVGVINALLDITVLVRKDAKVLTTIEK